MRPRPSAGAGCGRPDATTSIGSVVGATFAVPPRPSRLPRALPRAAAAATVRATWGTSALAVGAWAGRPPPRLGTQTPRRGAPWRVRPSTAAPVCDAAARRRGGLWAACAPRGGGVGGTAASAQTRGRRPVGAAVVGGAGVGGNHRAARARVRRAAPHGWGSGVPASGVGTRRATAGAVLLAGSGSGPFSVACHRTA
ncbi:hypothetical protein BU14_2533s0001 [Porphyra umbilicalis]|uniref:Uncharacterized protein n=1 Tax=Porphyra umbilicalis TaxID=2786 RepID=A0A1X6NIZ6_PORUM|nr:hypothetical protein BU14_2533s0001 [Porphyra umbilicalis]|eukprot:OSX68588.1 hypothetical protein BU14_2533s0001 [Porphyra umbilicalis]